MKEIIQPPHLKRPDSSDVMEWAVIPRVQTEWMRHAAPQLGLDAKKVIIGSALSNITGDDVNAFGFEFYPSKAEIIRKHIFERMSWESELPEMPKKIKVKLKETLVKLEGLNFADKKDFDQAKQHWTKNVRDYTKSQIAHNKRLRDAISYSRAANWIWQPYWNQFMYGAYDVRDLV